jgi:Amt family ammonium transporter
MPRYASRILPGAAFAAALIASLAPALAADAPTPNKGDTAWMLTATVLVLLMTVPGLALFYAGLVRAKNVVSMLMQVLAIVCLVAIIWVAYGYSLAFTGSGALNSLVGGLSKLFLLGIGPDTTTATFSNGVVIPELVFICFQMTFACITAALIVGGFAERMKFSALLLFVALWVTFVYFPMAHMVWYWAGPDALADAARSVAEATGAAKTAAEAKLAAVKDDAGLIFSWGALDFAGGTVVHINSGVAALVGAIMLGKRIGYRAEPMAPHSVTLTMVGAALLWVGWFGFNAGSALESGAAGLALANTFVAAAAAGLAWAVFEFIFRWKFSLLGLASGVVAGLVAITPAAGFSGVMGAMALGAMAGVVCLFFCTVIKSLLRYDDSLDVFGIHAVGGILGAIGTGLVVNPEWGGTGLLNDYVTKPGEVVLAAYDLSTQVIAQAKGVVLTIVWSGVGSFVIFKVVDLLIGARVTPESERTGLDLAQHGERGYAYET